MKSFLLPFFLVMFSIILYPPFCLYVVFVLNFGLLSWVVLMGLLSPYFVFWYIILKKRMLSSMRLIESLRKSKEWNIEKSLKEYLSLIKNKDKQVRQ